MEPIVNLNMNSPFDFLLDDANANNLCAVVNLPPPDWRTAISQCKAYRDNIRAEPIPSELKVTSYLIKKADILALLSRNTNHIDAVRIYIGHEQIDIQGTIHNAVRLFVVPCISNGTSFDDFGVPGVGSDTSPTGDQPAEARPCPDECGSDNALNTSPA